MKKKRMLSSLLCVLAVLLVKNSTLSAQTFSDDSTIIRELLSLNGYEKNEDLPYYAKARDDDTSNIIWRVINENGVEDGRVVGLYLAGALESTEETFITKLPESLKKLDKLRYLNLMQNNLQEIPSVVYQLVSLDTLILYWNKIEEISSDIGNLKNLVHLDIAFLEIKSIPEEIGDLVKLRYLSFYLNDSLQTIPISMTKLDPDDLIAESNKFSCNWEDTVIKWIKKYDDDWELPAGCSSASIRSLNNNYPVHQNLVLSNNILTIAPHTAYKLFTATGEILFSGNEKISGQRITLPKRGVYLVKLKNGDEWVERTRFWCTG
jgi:hypothetical protein